VGYHYPSAEIGRVEYASAELILPEAHPRPHELREPLAEVSDEAGVSLIATHVAGDIVSDAFARQPRQIGRLTLRLWIDEREGYARTAQLPEFQDAAHIAAKKLHTSKPIFDNLPSGAVQVIFGMASGYTKDAPPLPATFYHERALPGWSVRFGHLVYLGRIDPEIVGKTDHDPLFRGFDKYAGARIVQISCSGGIESIRHLHKVANEAEQYHYTIEGSSQSFGLHESISYMGELAYNEAENDPREPLFTREDLFNIRTSILQKLQWRGTDGVIMQELWEPERDAKENILSLLHRLDSVGYIEIHPGEHQKPQVRLSSYRLWAENKWGGSNTLINRLRWYKKPPEPKNLLDIYDFI
jgi:hypothetical protein